MKVSHGPAGDVLYVSLRGTAIEHTEEIDEGVMADFDSSERVVGIEILDASTRVDNPAELLFTVHQNHAEDDIDRSAAVPA